MSAIPSVAPSCVYNDLIMAHLCVPAMHGAARFLLGGIKLGNAFDRFLRYARASRSMDIDQLAPNVGHAHDLSDLAGMVKLFEAGTAVGVYPALVLGRC